MKLHLSQSKDTDVIVIKMLYIFCSVIGVALSLCSVQRSHVLPCALINTIFVVGPVILYECSVYELF